MKIVMRVALVLLALFNAALGVGFLLKPAELGQQFFLSPIGAQGLATMRADFTAFFIGAAVFALIGAWRAKPGPLYPPILLLSIAFAGRCVSLALDGVQPTAFQPMIVEAVMIAILASAAAVFRKAG
ncbi:MAG: hypothetical protein ACOYM8_13305 [Caulobacterales bacterium]|jgi:hypothetical protein